ncbi:serine hydrolase [Streptomyces sp. NBC_01264]|uniref:serine hydrolase n=1 Tax=Streptomyces sp. NBC_01264 TaxID=2903804 RepID=UPI0022599177|nr:serine hydrolase [Streptomyces sp. NBC_01264]MCX4781824.1 class A beta-lactamase-related serine hydrolase [Streptomyces sp. NBC_01264]
MISKVTRPAVVCAGLASAVSLLVCGPPAHALEAPRAVATATAETADGAVSCTSADRATARTLTTDIAEALRTRRSTVSLALDDRGTATTCVLAPQRQYDAASVSKPIILGALLRARGGRLSAEEEELARKMIVTSDNDAASALWKELSTTGSDGVTRPTGVEQFLKAAGLNGIAPGPGGAFGLTRVDAQDLVRLLRVFRGEGGVLTSAEGSYALGLMHEVRNDQRWGTPASAPRDAEVHVKNGWLQRSDKAEEPADRGDWRINSMAAFTGAGHDYDLVVLTQNNRAPAGQPAREGYRYGIATVEGVAKAVHSALNAGPSAGPPRPGQPDAPTAGTAPPRAAAAAAEPRRAADGPAQWALDGGLAGAGLAAVLVGRRVLLPTPVKDDS